jgi:hypothetical protein
MPSAFKDDNLLSNPPPPLSLQRDSATLPSREAAIISRVGSAVAGVIGALSPHCAALLFLIGASPFDQRLVNSSISTATKPAVLTTMGMEESQQQRQLLSFCRW